MKSPRDCIILSYCSEYINIFLTPRPTCLIPVLTYKGAKINVQTQYILCTRSKRKHRKAIEVCHKCRYLKSCDDYQQSQAPELVKALDDLLLMFNKKSLRREDLLYFKKEIEELAALLRGSTTTRKTGGLPFRPSAEKAKAP